MTPSQSQRRAVIDIGTNSVKLLVADVLGRVAEPVLEKSEQTRLGRGFYEEHRLQSPAIADTARAVAEYAAAARALGVASIRAIATSAARDAVNAADLLAAVGKSSGLRVEVIPGELEADFAFQGVATDPAYADCPLLIVDVGGGSTEFILGCGGHQVFRRSFPLGTVRMLEKHPVSDPPGAEELSECRARIREFLRGSVAPTLSPALREDDVAPAHPILIGTGGTTTIMARIQHAMNDFDRAKIEATRFLRAEIEGSVEHLWSLPLAERRRVPGLPANRADVILYGVAIFEAVMEAFAFDELRVSTRGLRFGAILSH